MPSQSRNHSRRTTFWQQRLALLPLLLVCLSACTAGGANHDPALGWLEAGSPKKLEVDRVKYRHIVHFDTDQDNLRADERDRLLAFLETVDPKPSESLRLEGHADERASDLYNLDLAARRAGTVKRFLGQHGLPDASVETSAFGERVPAASGSDPTAWRQNRRVELVLERFVVTPPACPDWSRNSGVDFANQPHSNFGCATETNLGLMIDNPRDLVRGRSLGPADGTHQAEGIVRYREGQLIELQEERIN